MYHHIEVMPPDTDDRPLQGSAYDIGQGGIHVEIDESIAPGTVVEIAIFLPVGFNMIQDPIRAKGRIVWIDEDGTRGPVRSAIAFTSFGRSEDRDRLDRYLTRGQLRLAA